jgi:hypothetical protein
MSTNYGAYNYSKAAKEYISSKYNLLVDTLSIDNQEIYDYPLTNVKAWRCNVWTNDANPYPIYINQVTKEISESDTAYINAEYVKRAAKYGKLDIPLYDKLSALEDSDVFCKYFFPKVAKYFSTVLQQEFPQCCKPYFAKLLVHCRQ